MYIMYIVCGIFVRHYAAHYGNNVHNARHNSYALPHMLAAGVPVSGSIKVGRSVWTESRSIGGDQKQLEKKPRFLSATGPARPSRVHTRKKKPVVERYCRNR